MIDGYISEQLEILRRIAETGKELALTRKAVAGEDDAYTDLFQHLLDEIKNMKTALAEV